MTTPSLLSSATRPFPKTESAGRHTKNESQKPHPCKNQWRKDGPPAEIEKLTGSAQFTYVTAVTKLRGDASVWQEHQPFRDSLRGNPIKVLTLQEMLSDLYKKTNTTVASSEVGRLLQVIKASGWKP